MKFRNRTSLKQKRTDAAETFRRPSCMILEVAEYLVCQTGSPVISQSQYPDNSLLPFIVPVPSTLFRCLV
jgi:hypothetical protein